MKGHPDVAMPWVKAALDPPRAEETLRRTFSLEGFDARSLVLRSARLVRHHPGRRSVIEYAIAVPWRGKRQRLCLMAKIRAKGLDRRTITVLSALRDSGFAPDSPDGISVPDIAAVVPEWNMWVSVKVEGRRVTECLAGAGRLRLAERVADAARKIHHSGVPATARHSMSDEIGVLDAALQNASTALPRLEHRIAEVSRGCHALAVSWVDREPTCIHRDFYGDQIIVAGDRLFILDFDQFCEGDAELDIGNFLAHITEQAIRLDGDPHLLDDVRSTLCDRAVQWGANRETIQVYDLLTLARHIWISTRIAERNHITEAILAECERRLARTLIETNT